MEKIELDSKIFGFDVYRATQIEKWLPGLTYLILDTKTPGLPYFDEKVELELDLSEDHTYSLFMDKVYFLDHENNQITIYESMKQLEKLAILAGKCSRFYLDKHTAPNADQMHKIWIRNHVFYKTYLTLVIYDEERIVALLALQDERISLLSRLPEYRKQGLAHALISSAIRELKEMGYKTMKVATQRRNVSALALYKAMGFKEVGSKFIDHIWKES